MKLYEIDSAIENFEFDVDEVTGEIKNMDAFDSLIAERDRKIENVALFVKNLSAEASAIKAEEEALCVRRKSIERKIDSLKKYLSFALNGEKFETPRCKIGWRKSKAVIVDDDSFIPWALRENLTDLVYRVVSYKTDKAQIKKRLEAGQECVGAKLEVSNNIQIK